MRRWSFRMLWTGSQPLTTHNLAQDNSRHGFYNNGKKAAGIEGTLERIHYLPQYPHIDIPQPCMSTCQFFDIRSGLQSRAY